MPHTLGFYQVLRLLVELAVEKLAKVGFLWYKFN